MKHHIQRILSIALGIVMLVATPLSLATEGDPFYSDPIDLSELFGDGEGEVTPADVRLTAFTIANSSTGTGSATGVSYSTAGGTGKPIVTVRGTYQIENVNGVTDALVTVTLANKNNDNYAFSAGHHRFFTTQNSATLISWPIGSGNHSVTADETDVTVSFTVSGSYGDSASFTIGYDFDYVHFSGWLPNGKLMAEVTAGGDLDAGPLGDNYKRTVTASAATTTPTVSLTRAVPGDVSMDMNYTLSISSILYYHNTRIDNYWRLEPGTDVTVVLEYPAGAQVTASKAGEYDTTDPDTWTLTWDYGPVNADGVPAGWSNNGTTSGLGISPVICFPNGAFSVGDPIALTARLFFTRAGTTVEVERTSTLPTFYIADGFIHLQPGNLTGHAANYGVPFVNIESTANAGMSQPLNVQNAGTLPVPNVCYTWLNDVDNTGKKANVSRVQINSGNTSTNTRYKAEIVYYIKGGTSGPREVTYFTGSTTLSGATYALTIQSATGLGALGAGEYIDKISIYPLLNDITESASVTAANPQRGLPVNAFIHFFVGYTMWPSKNFPNGTLVANGDVTHIGYELSWEGESKPQLHTAATVVSKTPDNGVGPGTTVQMANTNLGVYLHTVYYYHNPILPNVSLSFPASSYMPGATFNATLTLGNGDVGHNWSNPIAYYIPPAFIEVDTSQLLTVSGGGTATIEEVTLDGKTAYKISVSGRNISGKGSCTVTPITLRISPTLPPGNYSVHNIAGTSGLLFGTTSVTPHSYGYVERASGSTAINYDNMYKDDKNLDANDWNGKDLTPYLRTSNSTTLAVSRLSKLDVLAEVYNDTAGAWQAVNTPGAQGTVTTGANGEGSFRLDIINSGNDFIGDIRLLDILPFVGEEERLVLSTAAKGSEWTGALKQPLTVTIYDGDGVDKTSEFSGYTIQYSTNGNPSYNGGTGGIQRTGGAAFAANGTYANAKSFLFNSNTFRLPPGCMLVIEGVIQPPAIVTAADIGKAAYNAFAVQAQYYQAATGTTGVTPASLSEPPKQKFVLVDMEDGAITQGGFVFKDLNGDDLYDAGDDALYAGVSVELWVCDAAGNPTGAAAVATATTDANGQYGFTGLAAGDYVIKVVKPTASPYDPYAFVAQGGGANASHIAVATGLGEKFTLKAGESVAAPTNAGVKATGKVTVNFYVMNPEKTVLSTSSKDDVAITHNTATTGQITAGDSPFAVPQFYQLKATESNPKGYSLSWDVLTATVEFEVELKPFDITYAYTGTVPGGAPTPPATDTAVPFGTAKTVADAPTMAGYTFSGWTTSDVVVADGAFAMPDNAVAFTGSWNVKEVEVRFFLNYHPADDTRYDVGDAANAGKLYGDMLSAFADPVRDDYEFVGWFTARSGGVEVVPGAVVLNTEVPLNIYARWVASYVTIRYRPNDPVMGAVSPGSETLHKTLDTAKGSTAQANPGFTFVNWTDSQGRAVSADATFIPAKAAGENIEATYTANFREMDAVTIYYVAREGGTVYPTSSRVNPVTGEPARSTATPAPGYVFVNWTDAQGNVVSTGLSHRPRKADHEVWRDGTTFYANFAIADSGTTITIPVTKVWHVPQGVANLPNVTITLRRDGKPYRTLQLGGGTWSGQFTGVPKTAPNGSAYAYTVSENMLPGFTLTSVTGSAEAGFTLTNTARELTVTFVDWNGTLLKQQAVPYGGSATPPDDPTRDGHEFAGWIGRYENVTRNEYVYAKYRRAGEGFFSLLDAAVPLAGGAVSNFGDCVE